MVKKGNNTKQTLYLIILIIAAISFILDFEFKNSFILKSTIPTIIQIIIIFSVIHFGRKPKSFYGVVFRVAIVFSLMLGILFGNLFGYVILLAILFYTIAISITLLHSKPYLNQKEESTIYFDDDCDICSRVRDWFLDRNTSNLRYLPASSYIGEPLTKVTYVDNSASEFGSVKAIANAMEHINLGYAALGWIMKFPGINYILQAIINSLGLGERDGVCEV